MYHYNSAKSKNYRLAQQFIMLKLGTGYMFRLYTAIIRSFIQSLNKLYIEMRAVWDPSSVTVITNTIKRFS
jgi:hypothetical protein